jgi:hypothetical protein
MLFPATIIGYVSLFATSFLLLSFPAKTMMVVPLTPDDIQYRRRVVA